jgi:glyoxylase-like metal-dependent hydrolase (beta-lactamase superfamily II)
LELIKIKEGIFYIKDSTNLPLFEAGSFYALFDAPIDKDKSKKVKKIIEENKFNLKFLIFSHHHADHMGGGNFLKNYFNLKTYSSKTEKIFLENPILEPIYLSSGGNPPKDFLNKWVLGEGVLIDELIENLNFNGLEVLELSGHSIGMIGIKLDNIIFSADTFFSEEILDKYVVPYFHSYKNFLEKMSYIKNLDFSYIVPSHGELLDKESAIKVIDYNIKRLLDIKESIFKIIKEPKSVDEIIKNLNLNIESFVVAYLIKSSILNLLHEAKDNNEIEIIIKDGVTLFKK